MIPVVVLSGFLGSGKTTLLQKAVAYYNDQGLKAAVLMNEVGDVNLDGHLIDEKVPMKEMLSGCICCTIRGDLGVELLNMVEEYTPDVIIVECTGVANPVEIIDAVTDGSMYSGIFLQSVITIIDAPQLLEYSVSHARNKSYRLMSDQIRCASKLIIHKTDLIPREKLAEVRRLVNELNPHALTVSTQHGRVDPAIFFGIDPSARIRASSEDNGNDHEHAKDHDCSTDDCGQLGHSHSYDHVVVHTHFFEQSVSRSEFEQMFEKLPAEIYRAKGIIRFTGSEQQMMFQFAYRELDIIPIRPQGIVNDVLVMMGENFSASQMEQQLQALETISSQLSDEVKKRD